MRPAGPGRLASVPPLLCAALGGMLGTAAGCSVRDQIVATQDNRSTDADQDAGSDGDSGATCPTGQQWCDGRCVDTQVDPLHCGQCDRECSPGQFCTIGDCFCADGLDYCGNACVDTSSDARFCGDCNNACTPGADEYCADGECSQTPCEDQGAEACGDNTSCVAQERLESSPLHCGECDNACDADELCTDGSCRTYYAATGCTECPCTQVCGSNLCCAQPGTVSTLICLVGVTECPH